MSEVSDSAETSTSYTLECANCGGDYDVQFATPDMDIQPVPLCGLCRVDMFWRERLDADLDVDPRST